MAKNEMYNWQVELWGALIQVQAVDKLQESREAARKAGAQWKNCARDMVITRLGRAV